MGVLAFFRQFVDFRGEERCEGDEGDAEGDDEGGDDADDERGAARRLRSFGGGGAWTLEKGRVAARTERQKENDVNVHFHHTVASLRRIH